MKVSSAPGRKLCSVLYLFYILLAWGWEVATLPEHPASPTGQTGAIGLLE